MLYTYSKTSDDGYFTKRTFYLQWTNCLLPAINYPYISTSDEDTASKQYLLRHCVHYSMMKVWVVCTYILTKSNICKICCVVMKVLLTC